MQKKIDVEEVFRKKNPNLYKFLPSAVFSYLRRIIHQEDINRFLERTANQYDFDFVKAVIEEFKINTKAIGLQNIPTTGGCLIASNHPLGGLDAMAMLNEIGKVRQDVKIFANDLLMNLENLKNILSPINKIGKISSDVLHEIEKIYSLNIVVATFPAGLVSRKQFPNGIFCKPIIEDLTWKKSFITKSKKYRKNIIPVYIDGKVSDFFYNFSLLRKLLGIKSNIEMLYLADEMYKQHNKTITIIFGKEIPFETFDNHIRDSEWAEKVRIHVYKMAKEKNSLMFHV
ncbi:MAG: glycerol acyltransferase [Bacteroidota bacterium]